ncbi:hypothetical protein BASA81_000828 [Batrachochytrium salamandrivorans]|nr:hypothetical protein BASA81_000828 [Batrachochytrium salamandrivorans]
MTSSSLAMQEIEFYSQSLSILDSSPLSPQDRAVKLKPLQLRLQSKVTMEQATQLMDLASRRGVEDDKRACDRALQCLLEFLPPSEATVWVQLGLQHANAGTRMASLDRLGGMQLAGRVELISNCVRDVDTKVATRALELLSREDKDEVNARLLEIVMDKTVGVDLWSIAALRVWDFAAKDMDARLVLLESLFACLEQVNDDVLFVLNLLEIAASLPRQIHLTRSNLGNLEATLLFYAKHEPLVANDAVRVLAALHFDRLNDNLEQLLDLLYERCEADLAALEVVGMLLGSSEQAWDFCVGKRPKLFALWLEKCLKHCHGGNELPRDVALDAISRAIRGGTQSPGFSLKVYQKLQPVLPTLLGYLENAVKSLHPQVQLSAYALARQFAAQQAKWGVASLFALTSGKVWFDNHLPSPNSNPECRQARFNVLLASRTDLLDKEHDLELVQKINSAIAQGPELRREPATVEVSVM